MMKRYLPIRLRLTLWYVLFLALTLIAFSIFLYFNLTTSLHRETDVTLETQAQQVLNTMDFHNHRVYLDADINLAPLGTYVLLYDSSGRHLLSSNVAAKVKPELPELQTKNKGAVAPWLTTVGDWRVLTSPVLQQDHLVAWLQMVRSLDNIRATQQRLLLFIFLALPLLLLLAVVGGSFLAYRALAPIDRITGTARLIGAGDLSRRLGLPQTGDEVGRLAATFDEMLDRLDRAFQRQRQFTADASHELRTPIAVIRSQAEAVLARARGEAEYRQALETIRDQAERMGDLVAKLLLLARTDAGREKLELESICLNDIVQGVAAEFLPLAEERRVRLKVVEREEVRLQGDQMRLTQLLVNLVDNALKYTPAGGKITVEVARAGQQAQLVVADNGIGIDSCHLPHIFERFYRVDKARSRRWGGAGLGLALCRWIAQAHGGSIEVASNPGQGSVFTVRLPLSAATGSSRQ